MNKLMIFCILLLAAVATGCDKKDSPNPESKQLKSVTLVYAVNNNNLSNDLKENERQMLEAMATVDEQQFSLLVYRYDSASGSGLYRVVKKNGIPDWELVKRYDNSVLSVDEGRIREVILDASKYAVAGKAEFNMFFWGHGNGWIWPDKYPAAILPSVSSGSSESQLQPSVADVPEVTGFGGEYADATHTSTVYIDLDKLAEAIPDNLCHTIWFDCCYMGSVEVAYQLRNKCRFMVAYPTEIMGEGLPYNKILPELLTDEPDYEAACEALFNYYDQKNEPVTVALYNMAAIERLAGLCRKIFALGEIRPSTSSLQNYSRLGSNTYFYDFGQYMVEYAKANCSDEMKLADLMSDFMDIYEDFALLGYASDSDFRGQEIKVYTGMSIHNFQNVNSARENYYRTLDWFKITRPAPVF